MTYSTFYCIMFLFSICKMGFLSFIRYYAACSSFLIIFYGLSESGNNGGSYT